MGRRSREYEIVGVTIAKYRRSEMVERIGSVPRRWLIGCEVVGQPARLRLSQYTYSSFATRTCTMSGSFQSSCAKSVCEECQLLDPQLRFRPFNYISSAMYPRQTEVSHYTH
jgi:hypothetical protein